MSDIKPDSAPPARPQSFTPSKQALEIAARVAARPPADGPRDPWPEPEVHRRVREDAAHYALLLARLRALAADAAAHAQCAHIALRLARAEEEDADGKGDYAWDEARENASHANFLADGLQATADAIAARDAAPGNEGWAVRASIIALPLSRRYALVPFHDRGTP